MFDKYIKFHANKPVLISFRDNGTPSHYQDYKHQRVIIIHFDGFVNINRTASHNNNRADLKLFCTSVAIFIQVCCLFI